MTRYLKGKHNKENKKGVLKSHRFDKEIKQIAKILQLTGCWNMEQDSLSILRRWIDYIKELKRENARIETIEKRNFQIDKYCQEMNKRMEVLEKQWNLLSKDEETKQEGP
ncbi:uncharacterized protein LOC134240962 [Saccostrea cucullata]|uniref:uncharacterized protein LOC134240962 n=1 Tax=Saccostrea cuccullata TaxID=36930 RepID=UPI002ED20971